MERIPARMSDTHWLDHGEMVWLTDEDINTLIRCMKLNKLDESDGSLLNSFRKLGEKPNDSVSQAQGCGHLSVE